MIIKWIEHIERIGMDGDLRGQSARRAEKKRSPDDRQNADRPDER